MLRVSFEEYLKKLYAPTPETIMVLQIESHVKSLESYIPHSQYQRASLLGHLKYDYINEWMEDSNHAMRSDLKYIK